MAVLILDEHGACVYANAAAREVVGLADTVANLPLPDDTDTPYTAPLPPEIAAFRWVAITRTSVREVRQTLYHPSGEQRIVVINAAPLAGDDSPPRVALSIADLTTQYRHYEEALRISEQRLKLATESASIGIWERDLATDRFHWDERMLAVYGLSVEQCPSNYTQWRKFVLSEDIADLELAFRKAKRTHQKWQAEFRIRRADGEIRHIRSFGQYIFDDRGTPVRIVGTNDDITDRIEIARALAANKERLEEAQYLARLGHWTAARETNWATSQLFWSPVIYEIFERDPDSFSPTFGALFAAIHAEDRERVATDIEHFLKYGDPGERLEIEHRIVRHSGTTGWVRQIARKELGEGNQQWHLLGTLQDITEQKELQKELEHRAWHDPVTDLFNRAKLQQQLRTAKAAYDRHGTVFSILLIDVDHFKSVNDRWGHAAGDAVLWQLSRRMQSQLRETDHLGRWGGEEFLILVSHADEQGAVQLAERVREAIGAAPVHGVGQITASLGTATIEPGITLETLEDRADQALYAAKNQGRNQVCRFAASADDA